MKITYPDGTVHEGRKDFTVWTDHLGISDFNFTGLSVHDVATDEGWWAFWSEMQGARYVEASDVEDFADYDWGWHKDQEFIDKYNPLRGGRDVFNFHHKNLDSSIVVKKQGVYDINGDFDVIFCHGLLYHLRHPLLAIDRMRASCKGFLIMETMVNDRNDKFCASNHFYRTHELGPISNWSGATTACVSSWLKDAGFEHVYFCSEHFPRPDRQTFVALVDNKHKDLFDANTNLAYCDRDYWQKVFDCTRFAKKGTYLGS